MKKEGIFTESYSANKEKIIELLNEARAREIIAYMEYKYFSFIMEGRMLEDMQELMDEHAKEEISHSEQLGERIAVLQDDPVVYLSEIENLAKKSNYILHKTKNYTEMLEDLYKKERIAIEGYRKLIKLCGFEDPVTRKLAEDILETEEHHADEIYNLLKGTCSSG